MTSKSDILRQYIDDTNDGKLWSVRDLAAFFDVDEKDLAAFFKFPVTLSVLEKYDIPPPPLKLSARSLSQEQKRWIAFCTNPHTTRNLQTMAREFGISIETHDRWMQQSAFREEYMRRIQKRVGATKGEVIRRQAQLAMQGQQKSVELLYRMSGEPLPELASANSQGVVAIEAVVKAMQEVLPPDLLAQVAGKLLMPQPNALPAPSPSSPTEVIEDD